MSTLRALGAAAAVAALVLFSGCSGESVASMPTGAAAGGVAEDSSVSRAQAYPEAAPSGAPDATLTPQIARTAQVSLKVTDAQKSVAALRALAASVGGQVTSENLVTWSDQTEPYPLTSTIVIQVPADTLDSTLDKLASVGTMTSRVVSSEDVTIEVADVDSRIATLNDSIDRLRALWKKAGSVRDLAELESQITQRISERDSLVAQQRALAGWVARSPITIFLETPPPAGELETTGFLGGLQVGWNALVTSARVLVTVIGTVLPFVAVAALIVVPLLVWRRRLRARRQPGAEPAQGSATPPEPESDQATAGE